MADIMNNSVSGSFGDTAAPAPVQSNPNAGVNIQPQTSSAPVNAQPQAASPPQTTQQQDPWAAFPDKPQAPSNENVPHITIHPANSAYDPWSQFPDAPQQIDQSANQPKASDQLRSWVDNLSENIPAAPDWLANKFNTPEDYNNIKSAVENPPTVVNLFKSFAKGTADIMDMMYDHTKPMTPDALQVLTLLSPGSVANGSGKLIAADTPVNNRIADIQDRVAAEPRSALTPATADVSKINPDTPISSYENAVPGYEAPVNEAVDKANVEKLQAIQDQINQLNKVGSTDPAGKAQLSALEDQAAQLRSQITVQPNRYTQATTPVAAEEQALEDKLPPQAPENTSNPSNAAGMKARASDKYNNADWGAQVLDQKGVNDLFDSMKGRDPVTPVQVQLAKTDPVRKFLDDFQGARNAPLTLSDANDLDKELGKQITAAYLAKDNEAVARLGGAQDALRDAIYDAPANAQLISARKDWQQAAKLRDMENIEERAANSDNKATALKTYLNTYKNNPRNMRGWSEDEKEALNQAAKKGYITDLLKSMGNKLAVPAAFLAEVGTGGITGGAAASVAAHAVTSGFKAGAGAIKSKQLQNVKNVISGNTKGPGILTRAGKAVGSAASNIGQGLGEGASSLGQKSPLLAPKLLNNEDNGAD